MVTKLFARIGAGAFVAVALTMTALQLREEPTLPQPEIIAVFEPDGDPLPAQLRACSAMGEPALSSPECRSAWAEKRRRFLGIAADKVVDDAASLPSEGAPVISEPPAYKGQ